MFRAFSRPSSGARWLQWQPLVLPSYRGDSCARPRTQHDCHHDMKVKPEAATAVIELLMMGGKPPETCWAVNKHQDNKLKNCCISLVIYLKCKTVSIVRGKKKLPILCCLQEESALCHLLLFPSTMNSCLLPAPTTSTLQTVTAVNERQWRHTHICMKSSSERLQIGR